MDERHKSKNPSYIHENNKKIILTRFNRHLLTTKSFNNKGILGLNLFAETLKRYLSIHNHFSARLKFVNRPTKFHLYGDTYVNSVLRQ